MKSDQSVLPRVHLLLVPGSPRFQAVRDALEQYIENSDDAEGEVIDAACDLAADMDVVRSQAADALPACQGATTWMERFRTALAFMCDGRLPPLDICEEWVAGVEVNAVWRLQEWVVNHAMPHWATGIGTIEAAETWANTPVEGEDHLDRVR